MSDPDEISFAAITGIGCAWGIFALAFMLSCAADAAGFGEYSDSHVVLPSFVIAGVVCVTALVHVHRKRG